MIVVKPRNLPRDRKIKILVRIDRIFGVIGNDGSKTVAVPSLRHSVINHEDSKKEVDCWKQQKLEEVTATAKSRRFILIPPTLGLSAVALVILVLGAAWKSPALLLILAVLSRLSRKVEVCCGLTCSGMQQFAI